jgi:hypothetical protein
MNKQEIKRVVKEAVDRAVESQKMLTENEKFACVAAAALGIATITAITVNAKLRTMKRRVNRCEKRLDDLENMCTDPNN